MIRFAVTGPTGCGKGYVCELITNKYGYPCLNTDRLVHEMYNNDRELISKLAGLFGDVILKEGKIDRSSLRTIVFNNKEKLSVLNNTVHTLVAEYCRKWFNKAEENGHKASFIDAPQFFEAGMKNDVDYVICVVASQDTRKERIMQRDNIDFMTANLRIQNQAENDEYMAKSDFVIINEGINDIHSQLSDIFNEVGL